MDETLFNQKLESALAQMKAKNASAEDMKAVAISMMNDYRSQSKVTPTQETQPEDTRNWAQKMGGVIYNPFVNLTTRAGMAAGDLLLTGINKVSGGALDKYTPEGNLSAALQRAENNIPSVPLLGTKPKPVSSLTAENVAGEALGTVALGVGNPVAGGALLGAGATMEEDKSAGEVALNAATYAVFGKILDVGFKAATPYIEKAAQKYGAPFLEKISSYVPESGKTYMNQLSERFGAVLPDASKINILPPKVSSTINKASELFNSTIGKIDEKASGLVSDTASYAKGKLTSKTAEQILATPEAEVSKLTAKEQSFWYKQQATLRKEAADRAIALAKETAAKDTAELTSKINQFQQELGTTNRETAISLKQPSQQLMKDSSAKYVELTGEAAEGSTALNKSMSATDLANAIDSKFEYNPEVGAALKRELGLPQQPAVPTPGEVLKSKEIKLTNQEILDKARDIMSTVSRTAKAGNRTYTYAEYQAAQKYGFLMEQLEKNGVDMKAANEFWKNWAPVRDRIVREVKPFEEAAIGKMPITSTLSRAQQEAKTPAQVASKLDAQNFVTELESRLGLKKGSLGADAQATVDAINKAKAQKINVEKTLHETIAKIKADKETALKTMTLKAYNANRAPTMVKKILIGLGIWGVAKLTGLDKVILHAAISAL